ncbi:MAG: type II toxin-antitoxin system HicB family antitoxin [Ruminococcus sp.]|nr:type II toxin-antitoxin system HicB family antitoxin [Ruminococcus sp.]MCM1381288.1 type II toxin-antitoxin system HicB family antitoxin [Muribaculaceae bacterium]MCM1479636.1 type II toxin-antitoxin system HicB family antitoxin [Muribaculaceae bacterium]
MNVKIYYPAVFQKEDTGYSVWTPDIEGCVSQGENLSEAMENIADAIGLALETRADHGLDIPAPSSPEKIKTEENQFVSAVPFDPAEYDEKYSAKAVKKTLTIPNWLNTMAERSNINFSAVLQKALIEEFHLSN